MRNERKLKEDNDFFPHIQMKWFAAIFVSTGIRNSVFFGVFGI